MKSQQQLRLELLLIDLLETQGIASVLSSVGEAIQQVASYSERKDAKHWQFIADSFQTVGSKLASKTK